MTQHHEDRRKIFGWLSMEIVLMVVGQIVVVTLAYAALKSDTRDVSTRVERNTIDIAALRAQTDHDREENNRLLRDLSGDVKTLLALSRSKAGTP